MKKHTRVRWIGVFLAAVMFAAWAPAADDLAVAKQLSNAYANLAEKVAPAVVSVTTATRVTGRATVMMDDDDGNFFGFPPEIERFFREGTPQRQAPERAQPRERMRRGIGSGFLIDGEGRILTNAHVVKDADRIQVRFANDDREYPAEMVGVDELSDLAVIRVLGAPRLPEPLALGDSDKLRIGNIVMAIGSPMGLHQSVSIGAVSAKGRVTRMTTYENYIQIDAAINPGNSGGPLVNLDGEVIGINTMISTASGGFDGIGFAIPSNQAKAVSAQLVATGKVTRGWLGIVMNPADADLAEAMGFADGGGVLVADVTAGTPAEKAGLERGDVILAYDGRPVKDLQALRYFVADTAPGTEVTLSVLRGGERQAVKVTIEPQPENLFTRRPGSRPGPAESARPDGGVFAAEGFGIEVRNLTDGLRSRYELGAGVQGVIVSKVDAGSGAGEKGLMEGVVIAEVDGKPTHDVAAFRAAFDAAKGKDVLLVYAHFPGQGDGGAYVALRREAAKE